jgi:type I restriction-modification system DNA methylase subunit
VTAVGERFHLPEGTGASSGDIPIMNHQALSSFIWSVADLLRGDYKQSDYGKVILPFTVLRRLDCVLEATKPKVLAEFAAKTKQKLNGLHPVPKTPS